MSRGIHALKRLVAAFPQQPVAPETLVVMAEELADIPAERLEQAIRDCIRESRWFPTIAELRERSKPKPVPQSRAPDREHLAQLHEAYARAEERGRALRPAQLNGRSPFLKALPPAPEDDES